MPRIGENIYKRKDGRWEGRYIKGRKEDGKIHYGYIYGGKYHEVKQKLFKKKIEYYEFYLTKENVSNSTITLQTWIFSWLKRQKIAVRPNTYSNYRSKLMNHVIPKIGKQQMMDICSEELQCHFEDLQTKLSDSVIDSIYRILNTCFNAAMEENLLLKNLLKSVCLSKQKRIKVAAFSKKEQKRIEVHADNRKDLSIIVALYTGLRIGELCGLKWSDVDWEEQVIFIKRNIQRQNINLTTNHQKSHLMEVSLKTNSSHRSIPLSNRLVEIFKRIRNEQRPDQNDYIFSEKVSVPIDPRTIRYRFSKLKQRTQVCDLPFHALRHTFATRCIEAGVPITTISSLLGHSSTKMTLDTYTNSFLSEKRKAVEKIELLCSGQD